MMHKKKYRTAAVLTDLGLAAWNLDAGPQAANTKLPALIVRSLIVLGFFLLLLAAGGCKKQPIVSLDNPKLAALADAIQTKWGKIPADLPRVQLVLISPHNENIQYEFEMAFNAYHALNFGELVEFQWRDVGGGSSSILSYLRNIYDRSETSGIDVLFGGGEYPFQRLAADKLLTPLQLDEAVWQSIPAEFSGMYMYDKDRLWCGSVLSGFGFIYNKPQLAQLGVPEPQLWQDLGKGDYFGLIILADPTQSGSAAATYEMIVQSAESWPAGWARLLAILSNAKHFADNASAAAEAPVLGEAPLATCIDFYGMMRVSKNPQQLNYVSPRGQTGYTPDPIGILKNAPHTELAQRFVNFVLSETGQALWALPAGHSDGPIKDSLNRLPISKAVYDQYAAILPAWLASPYVQGAEMKMDAQLRETRYGVLAQMVRCAGISNRELMQQAKKKLIANPGNANLATLFNTLPDNVLTTEKIQAVAEQMKDAQQADLIITAWTAFFHDQFQKVIDQK